MADSPPAAGIGDRLLYHCDNLLVLRGLASSSVDLVATDPPFNKGRSFHAVPESAADGHVFQDRWPWNGDDLDEWADTLRAGHPDVWAAVEVANRVRGEHMGAFLCFMGIRLLEMRRVLKPSGCLYLHCDASAAHYLKLLLDAVFGPDQYRNEIIWCYTNGGASPSRFAPKHDTILCYSNGGQPVFNTPRVPYTSGQPSAKRAALFHPHGKIMLDWWADIGALNTVDSERVGYPTQKPVALYERIVAASTHPGAMVLDPFCGSGTTLIAAERLGRRWIGVDLWAGGDERVVLARLLDEGLDVPRFSSDRLFSAGQVVLRSEPPARSEHAAERRTDASPGRVA